MTIANPAGKGSLIECLRILARLHGQDVSPQALTAGLPLQNGDLTPSIFERAARRCGFASRVVSQPLEDLNPRLLPAVLLLQDNSACVVSSIDPVKGTLSLIYPELPDAQSSVTLAELSASYSGNLIYCRPSSA